MVLKYKVGDEVITHGMSGTYTSLLCAIPNGTRVRIRKLVGSPGTEYGYLLEDERSRGWWAEANLLPINDLRENKKSGFGKWVSKHET